MRLVRPETECTVHVTVQAPVCGPNVAGVRGMEGRGRQCAARGGAGGRKQVVASKREGHTAPGQREQRNKGQGSTLCS